MPSLRHTPQRQAVLRIVKLSPQPLAAEDVFRQVKKLVPGVGPATIYRNLEFLSRRGEIYRLEGEDGITRYVGHSIHQIVFRCQRCGKIRELPSETLQHYVNAKMPGQQAVFFSRLVAQGLCASCLRLLKKRGARA